MPLQKVWPRLKEQSKLSCLDAVGWQKPGPLVELLHLVDEPSRAHIAAGFTADNGHHRNHLSHFHNPTFRFGM